MLDLRKEDQNLGPRAYAIIRYSDRVYGIFSTILRSKLTSGCFIIEGLQKITLHPGGLSINKAEATRTTIENV